MFLQDQDQIADYDGLLLLLLLILSRKEKGLEDHSVYK